MIRIEAAASGKCPPLLDCGFKIRTNSALENPEARDFPDFICSTNREFSRNVSPRAATEGDPRTKPRPFRTRDSRCFFLERSCDYPLIQIDPYRAGGFT